MTRSIDQPVLSHLDAITRTLGSLAERTVLDIGCGASTLSRDLAALGADCTGIDPFMPARDWADEGKGRWRILRASAEALPFAAASIDAVLFLYSLHHVPGALLEGALAEAHRVLKPMGRLYVAEPLAQGDFNDLIATFHDEAIVRRLAQDVLHRGRSLFSEHESWDYVSRKTFDAFEPFAAMMQANTRFNDYAAEAVAAPAVRECFDSIVARTGGVFDQPVRVDVFSP